MITEENGRERRAGRRMRSMNNRPLIVLVLIGALALVALFSLDLPSLRGLDDAPSRNATPDTTARRDFMFQVDGFKAEGQTIDMYFHYRYNQGIAENNIPDFRSLRTDAIRYMDQNAAEGVYWEDLSKGVCTLLKRKYPVEAISCQLRIHPGRDPGFSSSIHTIGPIEPLAIPGPNEPSQSN
jgi:hypothetical protein